MGHHDPTPEEKSAAAMEHAEDLQEARTAKLQAEAAQRNITAQTSTMNQMRRIGGTGAPAVVPQAPAVGGPMAGGGGGGNQTSGTKKTYG